MSGFGSDREVSLLNDPLVNSLVSAGTSLLAGSFGGPVVGSLAPTSLQHIVQIGDALFGEHLQRSGIVGGITGSILSNAASGSSLKRTIGITAGMSLANLGISMIERGFKSRRGGTTAQRADPLRGVSSKSKTKMKSRKVKSDADVNLQQLVSMFPHMEEATLENILANQNGNLEPSIDIALSRNAEVPESSSRRTDLPSCPECPVCFSSLLGKMIFQCVEGHSLCSQCKEKPQVKRCPTCRGKFVGRATNMEQLLEGVYGTS